MDLDARSAVRVLLRSGNDELGAALGELVAGLSIRGYDMTALLAWVIIHVPTEGVATALTALSNEKIQKVITALPEGELRASIGRLIDQLADARARGILEERAHAIAEAAGQCRETCPGWSGQISCSLALGHAEDTHRGAAPDGLMVSWARDARESYWRARRTEAGLWQE